MHNVTALPHGTSLLDIRTALPVEDETETKAGLRIYRLPAALLACAPGIFNQNPTDMRSALNMVRDASELLDPLLEGGHTTIAGRLAGAYRNIGRDNIAEDVLAAMRSAGYAVRENDPFESQSPIALSTRERSPYVNRIYLMWQEMREQVIQHFPNAPGLPKNKSAYIKQVEEIYITDAYHSLSIEGYRVTPELIERVRTGSWNPDANQSDLEHHNALAARGYWQAYQSLLACVTKTSKGENAGSIAKEDHRNWYRELFAPGVTAGILDASDLAGYRNASVYIRGSMHVPPRSEAVRDAMPAFFDLLSDEAEPSVRVVLGHFIFVYIHPYMDGNGRMGRFMMNLMLASGGYPWTVIPVEERDRYMAALEKASVYQDIVPFTKFLARLVGSKPATPRNPQTP